MWRSVIVVLAACSPDPSNRPPPTDAAPDTSCSTEGPFAPIHVTGTSPVGDLSSLRFVHLVFASCGTSYTARLTDEAEEWTCARGSKLVLEFSAHHEDDGALVVAGDVQAATARVYAPGSDWAAPSAETAQVEFRAEDLRDYRSGTEPLRVEGRYVSNAPGWSFDIAIDADVVVYDTCQ